MNSPLTKTVAPEDLKDIPVGSFILVSDLLDTTCDILLKASIWFVFTPGKATLVDRGFPYLETEDLEWFARWKTEILNPSEESTP